MICPKCGCKIPDNSNRCNICGTSLNRGTGFSYPGYSQNASMGYSNVNNMGNMEYGQNASYGDSSGMNTELEMPNEANRRQLGERPPESNMPPSNKGWKIALLIVGLIMIGALAGVVLAHVLTDSEDEEKSEDFAEDTTEQVVLDETTEKTTENTTEATTKATTEATTRATTEVTTTEAASIYNCKIKDEIKNAQPFEYKMSVVQIADMLFYPNMSYDDVMKTFEASKFDWAYYVDPDTIVGKTQVPVYTICLDGEQMFDIYYGHDHEKTVSMKECYLDEIKIVEGSSCPYYTPYVPGGIGRMGEGMPDYYDFISLLESYGITSEKNSNLNFDNDEIKYSIYYEEASTSSGNAEIRVVYYMKNGERWKYFVFDRTTHECIYTQWDEGYKVLSSKN